MGLIAQVGSTTVFDELERCLFCQLASWILLYLHDGDPGYQALLATLDYYGIPYIGGEIVWNDPHQRRPI